MLSTFTLTRVDSISIGLIGLLLCLFGARPVALGCESQDKAGVLAASAPAGIPCVHLAKAPETETLWFRLDPPSTIALGTLSDDRPAGIARWISGPLDPEVPEAGRRIELEFRWMDSDVRLMLTERILPEEHRVLWREQQSKGGRTVMISVDRSRPEADLKVTETAAGKVRRRTLPRDRGAWQLLSLIESACQGVEPHGSIRVLMPQKAAVEQVDLKLDLQASPRNERELDLRYANGLEGPSFRFEGRELVGFTWQEGGSVATRISSEQYAKWVQGLGAGKHDQS